MVRFPSFCIEERGNKLIIALKFRWFFDNEGKNVSYIYNTLKEPGFLHLNIFVVVITKAEMLKIPCAIWIEAEHPAIEGIYETKKND